MTKNLFQLGHYLSKLFKLLHKAKIKMMYLRLRGALLNLMHRYIQIEDFCLRVLLFFLG